jgi:hypothetical protein
VIGFFASSLSALYLSYNEPVPLKMPSRAMFFLPVGKKISPSDKYEISGISDQI